MIPQSKLLSAYDELSYEAKIQKVMAMLSILKEEGNIFSDLYEILEIWDGISESFVDTIYQIITKAMYSLHSEELDLAVNKLEQAKSKISQMKEKEKQEEWNPDDLLDNI